MTRIQKIATWIITVFVVSSVVVDQWFAAKHRRYVRLQRQYECYPLPCSFDITGDSTPERLFVYQPDPAKRFERFLLLKDGDKELLKLPYDHTDNTFRTHAAIRKQTDGTRLSIYDGSAGPDKKVRSVYRWDGKQIVKALPDETDTEIINAMSAGDDTGTFNSWVVYQLARIPFYALIVLLAVISGFVLLSKNRRNKNIATSSANAQNIRNL